MIDADYVRLSVVDWSAGPLLVWHNFRLPFTCSYRSTCLYENHTFAYLLHMCLWLGAFLVISDLPQGAGFRIRSDIDRIRIRIQPLRTNRIQPLRTNRIQTPSVLKIFHLFYDEF